MVLEWEGGNAEGLSQRSIWDREEMRGRRKVRPMQVADIKEAGRKILWCWRPRRKAVDILNSGQI